MSKRAPASLLEALSNKIERFHCRLSIKNKIIGGYALTLGIAVGGTIAGLTVGNYYQQKASASWDSANQQGRLLGDLQVAMLQTLPTREFVPLLEKQTQFGKHKWELPHRAEGIKTLISQLQSSGQTTATKNLGSLLNRSQSATEKFYQQLSVVLNQVEPLLSQPESAGAAKKLITDFTGGAEFGAIVSSAYELTAFIKTARYQEHEAQLTLEKAESLRNHIIAASMALSVLIAFVLAFSTSRAIASPIEAVTRVAQQASYSSDFTVAFPVSTSDEIGLLATSFNNLIQRVAAKTQELSQTNQQREQAIEQLQHEIAERFQAQEALRESEQRFRQLAENINQVFWMRSPDTSQILYISPAYEKIWGKSCASLYEEPQSFLDAVHPDDRSRVSAAVSQQSQSDYDLEYRIVPPNGSVRWIRDRSFAVRDATGQVYRVVGIAEDITERKRAEEEVKKALEKEIELSDLKSRFITTTSHEFRTPLTTISFSAGLLKDYGHKWSEEKKLTHFERIQVAIARMTQLLEEVLFIGKAEAGKLQFNPVPLELDKFCRELVEEQQLSTGSKYQISFVNRCDRTHASLDEKLLRHILTNLLSNAIKYSPDGGEVDLELSCQEEKIVFQIKDRGIGIPLEDQQRLFESFHRASNVENIPGTGLGLAIVKKCVDLHSGEIAATSEMGLGTTFTVTIPAKPAI